MKRTKWKKAEVKKAVETIAQAVAAAFNVPAPEVFIPDYLPAREWEYRFETIEVWTKAGAAKMNVIIDDHFAHMYFQFNDEKAAADLVGGYGRFDRLNKHSGKWNSLESAPHELRFWIDELVLDFARVAEPNPPAEAVAIYEAQKAADALKWEQYRAEWQAQQESKQS